MTDLRPLVPTSSDPVPDEALSTSSLVPLLKGGRGRGRRKRSRKRVDLVPRPEGGEHR